MKAIKDCEEKNNENEMNTYEKIEWGKQLVLTRGGEGDKKGSHNILLSYPRISESISVPPFQFTDREKKVTKYNFSISGLSLQ